MKKYTLKLNPYPLSLKLVLSDNLPDKDAFGLTSLEDGGIVLVQMCDEVPDEDLLNICIHEAVHAVQFVEDVICGSLDQETSAYLTAFIACWIFQRAKHVKSTP